MPASTHSSLRVASNGDSRRPSLVDVAKGAAEDLLDLLVAQIRLARVELVADARAALRRVARLALFIPPLLLGYGFAMAALASWLGRYWGLTAALGAVAAFHIAVGGVGIVFALRALSRVHVLERASSEAADTVQHTIAAVSHQDQERVPRV